jgi:hypothetical protein
MDDTGRLRRRLTGLAMRPTSAPHIRFGLCCAAEVTSASATARRRADAGAGGSRGHRIHASAPPRPAVGLAAVRRSAGEHGVGHAIPYVDQIAGHATSNRRRTPSGADAYAFVVWAAKHDSPRYWSGLAYRLARGTRRV